VSVQPTTAKPADFAHLQCNAVELFQTGLLANPIAPVPWVHYAHTWLRIIGNATNTNITATLLRFLFCNSSIWYNQEEHYCACICFWCCPLLLCYKCYWFSFIFAKSLFAFVHSHAFTFMCAVVLVLITNCSHSCCSHSFSQSSCNSCISSQLQIWMVTKDICYPFC